MDNNFYTSLEQSISKSRLSTYNKGSDTNEAVLANYILNSKISQNFYFLLQNLEVSLRNSIYTGFKKHYSSNDFFYLHQSNSFERYKSKKEKHSRECWKMLCGVKYKLRHIPILSDGKIISELNFGFWTELLTSKDKRYINMWRKIFNNPFPNYELQGSIDKDKIIVANTINDIRLFRNRIFHYEPIYHQVDLVKKHTEIFAVLGWINKEMQQLNQQFDNIKNKQEIFEQLSMLEKR